MVFTSFELVIIAAMTYFSRALTSFHIIDMVPAKVTPLSTNMILLLSLKTRPTNTVAEILRQLLTSPTELLFTKLTNCQVQVHDIYCRHILALHTLAITLVYVHVMDQANRVFAYRAFVLWRLVSWIITWNKRGSCALRACYWKIAMFYSSLGKVLFNKCRGNVRSV